MMKSLLIFTISILLSNLGFAADEIVNVEKAAVAATTVVAPSIAAEEQIPLNIDVVKKSAEAPPASTRILLTGIVLAGMLTAAYYFVRKYKTSNTINKSNMQIKVMSQHYLGPKKSLAIIHVAGESMLVGITDTNISMIKSLSLIDDEVPTNLPKNFNDAMSATNGSSSTKTSTASHGSSSSNMTSNQMGAGATALQNATEEMSSELEEEFSFAGLKDTVSKKLKSMRSI